MKLGLLTAPFPRRPLTEVADWAAGNGFRTLEVACWPRSSGEQRRYAGTSHIDVANLSAAQAGELDDSRATASTSPRSLTTRTTCTPTRPTARRHRATSAR